MIWNDFITILQREFKNRQAKNQKYSLRKFAQRLQMDASLLSKILRGERNLSVAQIQKIGHLLNLPYSEIERHKHAAIRKLMTPKNKKKARTVKFSDFVFEDISMISGWHFFAILELFSIKGLHPSALQISRCLEISEAEAKQALECLEKLELLQKDPEGNLFLAKENNAIPKRPFSTKELKDIQKQFLQKASDSLEKDPIETRDHSGITMAISIDRMDEAKELIKVFRRRFMRKIQKPGEGDHVYQLTISFFPLSRKFAREET